jgi:hypothetical protein
MEAEFCNTFYKSMEAEFCNTFDKSIERVRQYCLYFLDDTPDLPVDCTDEVFDAYFIKKYPLLNHKGLSNGKTECFDMADALFDIKHPQFNEISGLLYSSIFISDYRAKNNIKLKKIYAILKDDPLALVDFTKIDANNS